MAATLPGGSGVARAAATPGLMTHWLVDAEREQALGRAGRNGNQEHSWTQAGTGGSWTGVRTEGCWNGKRIRGVW